MEYFSSPFTFGILGGGQLGKMLLQASSRWDIRSAVLDPSAVAPARHFCTSFEQGSFKDYDTVLEFGRKCDVLTIEIEHVNTDALFQLKKEGVKVCPSPDIIAIIQDKGRQKVFYEDCEVPTLPFQSFNRKDEVDPNSLKFPVVYKSKREGYDGKGVKILRAVSDFEELPDVPFILESFLDRPREIAVIVNRNASGECVCFPAVEMEFHPTANLVEYLYSPAQLNEKINREAAQIAQKIATQLQLEGTLAVEMFIGDQEQLFVNECAPRPHNSGHHTIESVVTSQYEQHVRSILNLPLGSTRINSPAVMINVLGDEGFSGAVKYEGVDKLLQMESVFIHLYGKKETRPFRKMGHITVLDQNLEKAKQKAVQIKSFIKVRS